MNRTIHIMILLVVAAMISQGMVWAQQRVTADVPFDFNAGKLHLPAGKYQVDAGLGASHSIIRISDLNTRRSLMVLVTSHNEPLSGEPNPRLVFKCAEGACGLAQVWTGEGTGWNSVVKTPSKDASKVAYINVYPSQTESSAGQP